MLNIITSEIFKQQVCYGCQKCRPNFDSEHSYEEAITQGLCYTIHKIGTHKIIIITANVPTIQHWFFSAVKLLDNADGMMNSITVASSTSNSLTFP